ncbi:hypothetical protein OFY05_23380 (plasmid) [Pseudocitrobacter faecalis]|nr:hypothetical protein OFY05_23380 [Pseudocitrobacter faecalis]
MGSLCLSAMPSYIEVLVGAGFNRFGHLISLNTKAIDEERHAPSVVPRNG